MMVMASCQMDSWVIAGCRVCGQWLLANAKITQVDNVPLSQFTHQSGTGTR
jgi:hypothetical protein